MITENFSNKQLEKWALRGTALDSDQALSLQIKVESDTADVKSRIMLLGFYFKHYHDNTTYRTQRNELLIWVIDNLWAYPFCSEPYCLVIKALEPKFFETMKQRWRNIIKQYPDSSQVYTNAAAAILIYEPLEAEKLIGEAKRLKPKAKNLQDIFERIQMRKHWGPPSI